MLILGSHVSFGKKQILSSLEEALSYGSNSFMFYTGAPTNTSRKKIESIYVDEAIKIMSENDIDIENVVCHAPYIVNLANRKDESKYDFSINFIKSELKRCDELGVSKMVLHPGNAVGITKEEGLINIATAINVILDDDSECMILLETMAGKGTECGSNIDEVKFLLDNIIKKNRIGVCVDTCHIFDAGYDLHEYISEFDSKLGLDLIKCFHINDSKNICGSHKDRHANIGVGTIGFDNLLSIIYDERFEHIPKILETPYIGETDDSKERLYAPYKFEIEMIKNKKFDPKFREKIRNYYNK